MSQFAFKRTGDADYPRHLKVLLQGPPKSGKTSFIATAPNVVVAACEAGLASIAHLDIPYVPVDGTEKLQNLEMILRDDTLRAHAAKQLDIPQIDSVAIDTLDAWQEMLKKEILAENRRTQMQQADWGTLKERMAAILKKFVTLPVNVIFTVHTTTTQDDESRLVYAPALQGSIKDEIAGYVDFSLLSFRQRETDKQGVPKIQYYLKCEGDMKNPHLGNRAAGRLPEIVKPDFMTLHKAVFSAIPTRTDEQVAQSSSQPTVVINSPVVNNAPPVAQRPSQPSRAERTAPKSAAAAPVAVVDVPPKPSGLPEDNPDGPITASGISMLTKSYIEHGLSVPEDLRDWNLGKGRKIAKWFMSWKADKAAGQTVTRDDLVAGLQAWEGYSGEIDGVTTGTDNLKSSEKKDHDKPAESSASAETEPVKSDDENAEEAALALVKQELGAVEIGYQAKPDATCEVCKEPVDEPDIANLAVIKFKKAMCLKDYKLAVLQAAK